MSVAAVFYDGETARSHQATVRLDGQKLLIDRDGQTFQFWELAGIHAVDPPAEGEPFRLTHDSHVGQRLIIRDAAFVKTIIAAAPHLQSGYFSRHYLKQAALWTMAGLALFGAVAFGVMSILPGTLAPFLPDKVKKEAAAQVVKGLAAGARECETPAGRSALDALAKKLAVSEQRIHVKVHVYDMELLNAFAVPGNEIILTREVIKTADSADEVAGVLAHEMGHVAHLHPEQQLVRLMGMQAVLSVFSGSNGGETLSNVAAIVALLSYSRDAEREADSFAREQLKAAAIDPMGFKHFFEKVQKLEGGKKTGAVTSALSKLGGLLSTHPGTEDRIKLIEPLPAGVTTIPALDAAQWTALQGICG